MRITVQSQPGQIVGETLSWKTLYKNRAGGVAQGEGLNVSPSTAKKEIWFAVNLGVVCYPAALKPTLTNTWMNSHGAITQQCEILTDLLSVPDFFFFLSGTGVWI
jgi:hypothetical protein